MLKRLPVLVIILALASCKPAAKRSQLSAKDMADPANARFLQIFAGDDQDPWFAGAIMTMTDGAPLSGAAFCVKRPVAGRTDMVLVIAFCAPPLDGQPMMQLQIAAPDKLGFPQYIDPVVLCGLDDEQIEKVYAAGVPAALVEMLVQRADAAGWDASMAKRVDVRWLYVDAAPFFVEG